MIKYITVVFFGISTQEYTYKCKSRRIKKGDFVIVPTLKGNTVVKVVNDNVKTPSFECKEVIRKVDLE